MLNNPIASPCFCLVLLVALLHSCAGQSVEYFASFGFRSGSECRFVTPTFEFGCPAGALTVLKVECTCGSVPSCVQHPSKGSNFRLCQGEATSEKLYKASFLCGGSTKTTAVAVAENQANTFLCNTAVSVVADQYASLSVYDSERNDFDHLQSCQQGALDTTGFVPTCRANLRNFCPDIVCAWSFPPVSIAARATDIPDGASAFPANSIDGGTIVLIAILGTVFVVATAAIAVLVWCCSKPQQAQNKETARSASNPNAQASAQHEVQQPSSFAPTTATTTESILASFTNVPMDPDVEEAAMAPVAAVNVPQAEEVPIARVVQTIENVDRHLMYKDQTRNHRLDAHGAPTARALVDP